MTAVDLAPDHRLGLTLANPVMPAAGCYGLGTEYADLVEVEALGALVCGPVTARARRGADPPRLVPIPGGLLVHTGLANPGVADVVRRCARAWAVSAAPVIVHVAGTTRDDVAACCERLSALDVVAGIELGVPDSASAGEVAELVRAAHAAAAQPLIVRLPLAECEETCQVAVHHGANSLTIAAPPRGTIWDVPSARFLTGRLYGPFVLPLVLRALQHVRQLISVPLIGSGGIHSADDARAMLRAGAVAVQVDAVVWRDPGCLARIAGGLSVPEAAPLAP